MALPIIFIHKGDSFYLRYALESAKRFNPSSRIILIGENVTSYPDFVEYHEMSKYNKSALEFRKIYKHLSTNSEEIERFCFERWFILNEFLKKNKINKCLTLDSDVLLFVDATKDSKKFEKYAFTLAEKCSGGLMYVTDRNEINEMVDFIFALYVDKKLFKTLTKVWESYRKQGRNGGVSDMIALGEYYKRNSMKIGDVSEIFNNETYDMAINFAKQGMVMENGVKKVDFVDGIPYCIMKKSGVKIKMCCLHFAGPTKFYMKYFAKGKVNFLANFTVKTLMFLRDNYSGLLNDKQRNFAKKVMVRLGL